MADIPQVKGGLRDYIQLLRPQQWLKNGFVFVALFFGQKATDPQALLLALIAFGSFCLLASAVYAFNDIRDRREDAHHPTKQFRPIARGAIPVAAAGVYCALLVIVGFGLAAFLSYHNANGGFAVTAAAYLIINLFYSLGAKKVALVDVIIIALGFVLRALGGAQAVDVPVSAWLVICTFTLCLFLGFGKRRCEIAMMHEAGGDVKKHRATLVHYTPDLLNHLLSTTGVLAVITFIMYTLDPHTARVFRPLFFTTPFVLYAIFRYAMVIETGKLSGPTEILIQDKPFRIASIIWAVLAVIILFQAPRVESLLPKLRWPGEDGANPAATSQPARPGVRDNSR